MSEAEKLNILLVDDQPGKLLSYEVILKDFGENLIKAQSGPRRWSTFSKRRWPSSSSTFACRTWTGLSSRP